MSDTIIRESEFRAEIEGVTALLMNNPASMLAAGEAKAKGKKAIMVPTVAVFQAMIEAGKLLNDPDNPRRRLSYKIAAALGMVR